MQLQQLETFLVVAEEGSVTRAAERLMVAQPSLSSQISRLERELGGALFDRQARGVSLTPAGRAFRVEAQQCVLAAKNARRVARAALNTTGGELEIATVLSLAVGLLPASISGFHRRRPGVTLGLREYRHRDALEQAVLAGVGDVAIGPTPVGWRGPVVPLGEEEFVVVLPRGDEAAVNDSLSLPSMAEREWVLYDDSHGLSDFLKAACSSAGFRPHGSVRTGQVEAAVRLAAAGIGPALIPRNVIPPGLRAAVRPLNPPLLRPLAAYARNEFSNLADAYVQVLRKTTRHLRPKNHMGRPMN